MTIEESVKELVRLAEKFGRFETNISAKPVRNENDDNLDSERLTVGILAVNEETSPMMFNIAVAGIKGKEGILTTGLRPFPVLTVTNTVSDCFKEMISREDIRIRVDFTGEITSGNVDSFPSKGQGQAFASLVRGLETARDAIKEGNYGIRLECYLMSVGNESSLLGIDVKGNGDNLDVTLFPLPFEKETVMETIDFYLAYPDIRFFNFSIYENIPCMKCENLKNPDLGLLASILSGFLRFLYGEIDENNFKVRGVRMKSGG